MSEKKTFESISLVNESPAIHRPARSVYASSPTRYIRPPLPPCGHSAAEDQLHQHDSAFPTSPLAGQPYSGAYAHNDTTKKSPGLKRTAYLDGLRGFGAFLVYILHHEGWAHGSSMEKAFGLEVGWGYKGHYTFAGFPWVRTFFTGGHLAVAVFFTISGYVLAAKPLSLIHSRETVALAENLGSALFRRWIRLFIPVAVLTFLWMSSWHVFGIRSGNGDAPERNYFDEVWKWYCDFKNYSFIFHENPSNAYSFHAWTIPLEFKGSILVYIICISLARCNTVSRLRAEFALIWYSIYVVDGWYCALFVIGMLLCDMDLLAARNQLPRALQRLRTQPTWVYYSVLIFALYLGGVGSIGNDVMDMRQTPGWFLLSFLKPQAMFNYQWFYRNWAATLLMVCIPHIRWLQSFFETAFCQYLGRISFGLYLVHGPILWCIGDRIYAAVGLVREAHYTLVPWWVNRYPFPSMGIYGLEVNFLAAQLVLLPLTLWVAEVFTQFIDEPSVTFGHWLLKHHTSVEPGFVV